MTQYRITSDVAAHRSEWERLYSGYAAYYNHPGIAVTVSTGDSGYGTQFPATTPTVIAVGGTTLTKAANTRGWSETAWNKGGSGCSSVYAKPSWQHDPLCTSRVEADISAVADPATGVAVYGPNGFGGSSWLVFGGTSVSAPLIGGIYLITMFLAQVLGGQVTALTLAPIAIATATATNVSARNIGIVVALACSSTFLTPLAHPVNLLMVGPGGYTFRDFARVGAGLTLVCLVIVLLGVHILPGG